MGLECERHMESKGRSWLIRLVLVLLCVLGGYLALGVRSDRRYRKAGGQVGLTTEIYLFQKDSALDRFGYLTLWPWSHLLGVPVYWYEMKLPGKAGQPIQVKYIPG